MPNRFDSLYRVKDEGGRAEALTREFFDTRFRDVDDRLAKIELLDIAWQNALAIVQDRVLSQSEQVIGDLRDKLVSLTQLQWLTALSGTMRTLEAGESMSFGIAADQRELFTPGPFVLLSRASTPDDYGIASTLNYDRDLGQLDVTIETVTGDPGPHDDWVIAALAGSTLAQMELLEQAQALQTAYVAYRDAAAASAAAADADATATETARAEAAANAAAITVALASTITARNLAQEWSTKTSGEVVTGQGYGAKKYAVDAAASAQAAANSAASISGGPVTSVAGLTGIVSTANLKTALSISSDIAAAVNALVNAAPSQLDTLNELAAALGNDANFASTITTALAAKANTADVLPRSKIVARIIAYGG